MTTTPLVPVLEFLDIFRRIAERETPANVGAMASRIDDDIYEYLCQSTPQKHLDDQISFTGWCELPNRTRYDVLKVVDRAIALARSDAWEDA